MPEDPIQPLSQFDQLRLASVVQSSDDAIVAKTLDGVIVSWNPAAERIFGYTAAEMIGQPIFKLIPPELHGEEHDILARIRAGQHVSHYETSRIRKDGGKIRISLTISPIYDPEGNLIGASAIKRDVTAQRRLEEQLRQSQKMDAVGQLAGGMAHDFNNILTVIEGFTAFALRSTSPESSAHADLLGIRHAVERAGRLTRQLLAFSRRQTSEPELLDLNTLLRDTVSMLHRLIGEDIQLQTRLLPARLPVRADRGQLTQVLLNLAVNARDAMPEGGSLTITTRRLGSAPTGAVAMEVQDTGHGMDDRVKARLFEPFFTTKPRGQGTGLGLAMAYGIIKQAGGQIEVESQPGAGACFRVILPAAVDGAEPDAVEPSVASSGGSGELILLVEDDTEIAALATRALKNLGYRVIPAVSPGEALVAFSERTAPIDLLLTDVVMPGMHGRALAERLREQEPNLPVLYMSGYSGHVLTRQRPDDDFPLLQKPFTPDELGAAVRRVLDARPAAT